MALKRIVMKKRKLYVLFIHRKLFAIYINKVMCDHMLMHYIVMAKEQDFLGAMEIQ